MNDDINGKPSLFSSISYYLKQCRASIVLGATVGTLASVLAIAHHFPGW